jgi:hypothetical protein
MCGKGGGKVRRTVKEGGGVDAGAADGAGKVPHSVEGDALCEGADDADDAEGGEEVDCDFAEGFEALACSWSSIRSAPWPSEGISD